MEARKKLPGMKLAKLMGLILCVAMLLMPLQGAMAQSSVDNVDDDVALDLIEGDNSGGGEVTAGTETAEAGQPLPEQASDLINQIYLPVIQGGNDNVDATVEAAFNRSWSVGSCNVSSSRRGLWDDMPGASEGDESGLLWLQTTSTANEQCSFFSNIAFPGISTTTFPTLGFRVAVNDGGIFQLRLYRFSNGVCNAILTTRVTTAAQAHSGFLAGCRRDSIG